jgi:hypothetical protein
MPDYLQIAANLIAQEQIRLELSGHHPPLVSAALKRARRSAQKKAEPLSSSIRDQAFFELLTREIQDVESWMSAELNSSTS